MSFPNIKDLDPLYDTCKSEVEDIYTDPVPTVKFSWKLCALLLSSSTRRDIRSYSNWNDLIIYKCNILSR